MGEHVGVGVRRWRRPHAVILAGGKGVRLRPYTTCLPKPLVPLGDECVILEVLLGQLARAGVGSVSIAIGHLGQLIRALVGDGHRWGLHVDYWDEESPLGTVGPLVAHRDELPDDFLVMNGDILTDLDFGQLLDRHRSLRAQVTVAAYRRAVEVDFGVLEMLDERISGFEEKPTLHYTVSMGVYALSAAVLDRFEPGLPLGFDDLLLDQLESGDQPHAFPFEGFWLDIGRPEDYDRANEQFPILRSVLIGSGSPRPPAQGGIDGVRGRGGAPTSFDLSPALPAGATLRDPGSG